MAIKIKMGDTAYSICCMYVVQYNFLKRGKIEKNYEKSYTQLVRRPLGAWDGTPAYGEYG